MLGVGLFVDVGLFWGYADSFVTPSGISAYVEKMRADKVSIAVFFYSGSDGVGKVDSSLILAV